MVCDDGTKPGTMVPAGTAMMNTTMIAAGTMTTVAKAWNQPLTTMSGQHVGSTCNPTP